MKIDCLLEITAHFFYPGDKVTGEEIEDIICWDKKEDIFDRLKYLGSISSFLGDWYKYEFTHEAIGFTYTYVREGRSDYNYCGGVEYECKEVGQDWFLGFRDRWVTESNAAKKEILKPVVPEGILVLEDKIEKPVRKLQWLQAAGYYSNYDSYTEEYEAEVILYDRVRFADIQRCLTC